MTVLPICPLPSPALPRCDRTDLPRLLCGCDEHARWNLEYDYDDLEPAEHDYLRAREQHPAFVTVRPVSVVKALPEYQAAPWGQARNVPLVTTGSTCDACGRRPAGAAFVCPECLDDLRVHLGDVPGLLDDLDVLANREAVVSTRPRETSRRERTRWDRALRSPEAYEQTVRIEDGTRTRAIVVGEDQGKLLAAKGYDRPLTVERAVRVRDELSSEVVTAVRAVTESRGITPPSLTVRDASRWLLAHLGSVSLDQAGPDISRGMRAVHKRAQDVIDNVEQGLYIGLCDDEAQEPCGAAMYANPDDAEHQCHVCRAVYDVADRREAMRIKVRERLLSSEEIVAFSRADGRTFGAKLTERQLAGWIESGRLVQVGTVDQKPTYRAGDVVALVESLVESRHEPLPLAQVADLLDIPLKTLYRWEAKGLLTPTDPTRRRGKVYDLGSVRVVAHAHARM